MKTRNLYGLIGLVVSAVMFAYCSKKSVVTPELSVSSSEIAFQADGGASDVTIASNVEWNINNPASSWLQVSQSTGSGSKASIRLTTVPNTTGAARSVVLEVNAGTSQLRRVKVTQAASIYPGYNTSPAPANSTGMGSNAVQLAAKFKLGWNIGNTLEAIGGETAWGNPLISESYIQSVKQQGFTAIRLPCAWNQYSDKTTAKIQDTWLNRVKQVVQYCVNNDMYVLLNIHWDGGWLDANINSAKKDSVNAKQKAFWEQIATTMRDFDEHVMFASANEPPAENAEQMDILNSYHQTFINAVRSTGGRNSYRVLVVQGPSTDIDKTNNLMNTLPTDAVSGRMMVEVHYYTPYQFCLMDADASWGKIFYYWGAGHHSTIEPDRNATWGEEGDVNTAFGKMKTKFTDKQIPVIMGEYGAYRRGGSNYVPKDLATHNDAVDYWLTYVTRQAIANGIKPFFWDTGGALDRRNNTVRDQRTIDALVAGGR
ncbi:cellulase family glycosylhydrolase [Chitinophaga ginsengisegetis]|nr:cellulase family glycosylhydrolase [Chitinophaga ginsengisegetis]MDR6565079.1 aryl-phospho-beta-D-glucosidase BglC (GH1 family) [Chitinophaga ginsengisegetis]MDR6644806.1 aryl-phospho-beta-D-glucosidase BglC (GH1 family) [Chitinophaga ginsengisegetis]MDR6652602.1 aryl-phospho-beta-D-glucosidase BglC (GH1 family) [Chitinophaga ginsengisegetis]